MDFEQGENSEFGDDVRLTDLLIMSRSFHCRYLTLLFLRLLEVIFDATSDPEIYS